MATPDRTPSAAQGRGPWEPLRPLDHPDPLFDVPAVKEALFLLLGGGLDEAGKEKWLAYRIERGVDAEYVFGEALEMLGGMVAT